MATAIDPAPSNEDLLPNDLGSPEWAASEFAGSHLGDRRLDKRLIEVAKALYAKPEAPINQACEEWCAVRAAYRFFENERVSARDIFSAHQQKTIERIAAQPLVLHIQDTVYLNYTSHPMTAELGPIGTAKQKLRGLVMHDTLSMTASGLPLGVLTHTVWARPNTRGAGRKARRKKSIQEKESRKWIDALEQSARLMPKGVRNVTICDAESDVFELFAAARRLDKDLLVRACQDRCLLGQKLKLWDFMASEPVKGYLQVDVPPSDKGPARKATVTVQFADVALKAPRHAQAEIQRKYPSIGVTAIYVKEEFHPPAEVEEPLEWMLLTNVATTTLEDATERIEWYKRRWTIEIFHKVLKSGCNVEKVQFEKAQRIQRYLALFVAIAYRILWIRDISRVCPDAPCTVVLAPHEWKALYAKVHHTTELPDVLPTAHQVVRWIGALGGHLGRKSDGEPGVTAIWRGWQRLTDLAEQRLLYYPEEYATRAASAPARSSAPRSRPRVFSTG